MNLLLLLSALLSALTGASGGARVPEQRVAMTRPAAIAAAAPRSERVVIARRDLPGSARRLGMVAAVLPRFALVPIFPIYFGRRRE